MDFSEEELKAHVSKGTLGKLTVPMLKEACRVCGLKGGMRKQELLDALTKHFQKDWLPEILHPPPFHPVARLPDRSQNFTFMRLSVAEEAK